MWPKLTINCNGQWRRRVGFATHATDRQHHPLLNGDPGFTHQRPLVFCPRRSTEKHIHTQTYPHYGVPWEIIMLQTDCAMKVELIKNSFKLQFTLWPIHQQRTTTFAFFATNGHRIPATDRHILTIKIMYFGHRTYLHIFHIRVHCTRCPTARPPETWNSIPDHWYGQPRRCCNGNPWKWHEMNPSRTLRKSY